MTRGNQREVDRQRSKKRAEKNAGKAKKKDKDGNASQALTNKKEKYVVLATGVEIVTH